jgi:site-specific recombinase XerD
VQNETTKDILSLCESNRLIASIDTSKIRGKRDKAIMALFLINGLRVCEIVRANVCDLVKRDECWVLRVHGKGNKEADTRIREDTYRVISAYLDARGSVASQEPLFIGTNHRAGQRLTTRAVQYMVKDRLYAIGVCRENVTCHSLRHSAISHLIRAGATLLDTQEFARHSSPSTTLRYIHNEDKIKKHAVLPNHYQGRKEVHCISNQRLKCCLNPFSEVETLVLLQIAALSPLFLGKEMLLFLMS